jgi:hypothetical protein
MASQAVEVAVFLVCLARQQNWQAIKVVDGQRNMAWAAWVSADYYSLPLFGFEVNSADKLKREKVLPSLKENLDQPLVYGTSAEYVSGKSMESGESPDDFILRADVDRDD